jgi:hypothetical protein
LTGSSLTNVNRCCVSGGEKTGVAGAELTALSADFRAGAAFQHIARLLDARMRMRQRPFSFLDRAENDLVVFCADVVPADQPAGDGTGVIAGL